MFQFISRIYNKNKEPPRAKTPGVGTYNIRTEEDFKKPALR